MYKYDLVKKKLITKGYKLFANITQYIHIIIAREIQICSYTFVVLTG